AWTTLGAAASMVGVALVLALVYGARRLVMLVMAPTILYLLAMVLIVGLIAGTGAYGMRRLVDSRRRVSVA
ncbi:MAG: hypothetical protein WAM30_03825, partial [Candidatus Dormiibacterota bacterium]